MPQIKFHCVSGCGACCRRVGNLTKDIFPEEYVLPDGSCIHLAEDMSCKIYDTRPEVCRVNRWYKRQKNDKKSPFYRMSRIEYYKTNNLVCNTLMQEDGIPVEKRINLGVYDNPEK